MLHINVCTIKNTQLDIHSKTLNSPVASILTGVTALTSDDMDGVHGMTSCTFCYSRIDSTFPDINSQTIYKWTCNHDVFDVL